MPKVDRILDVQRILERIDTRHCRISAAMSKAADYRAYRSGPSAGDLKRRK